MTVPADLSKLYNVVDNDAKKNCIWYIGYCNAIDTKIPSTNELIAKIQYNSEKEGFDNNIEYVDKTIPNSSWLVKKTDCKTKIENKMPHVTELVTTTIQNTKATDIETIIPDNINLATKVILNTKTS